jgi:hypothetical protein
VTEQLLFVARIGPGPLESQALLLCRSIRRFAGSHRDARIVLLQARDEDELRLDTRRALSEIGVELRRERLNEAFPGLPMANKTHAAAWAERNSVEDVVVFVDSDTFFAQEPLALQLPDSVAAVRPVNAKNIGSAGPDDPRDEFWTRVHERFGTEPPPLVRTTVTDEEIHGYWNSGLVATRRDAGLMNRWCEITEVLLRERFVPANGALNQLDQVALAVALAGIDVEVLDGSYNYPLPLRERLPAPLATARLDELVHVHYFRSLHLPGFLETLAPPLDLSSPVADWLREHLPLAPTEFGSEPRKAYRSATSS